MSKELAFFLFSSKVNSDRFFFYLLSQKEVESKGKRMGDVDDVELMGEKNLTLCYFYWADAKSMNC